MTTSKFHLLAATAAIGAFGAGSAQAQFVFPTAEIDGGGASLPANAQRQAFDCYGAKTPLAFSGAASATNPTSVFDFNFPTTATPTKTNQFNCDDAYVDGSNPILNGRAVQPGITARYFSTGSGAGITAWQFHVSPENNPIDPNFVVPTPTSNGVTLPAGFATFTYGVQFANSDNALSFNNLSGVAGASSSNPGAPIGYNNRVLAATVARDGVTVVPAGTAASRYGAAIQIPVYVAPVAFAYSAIYAKEVNGGNFINNYRFAITGARPDGSGGLKLTRAQYCGIMNGVITNWNQLPVNVVNKDVNDPLPFNVPIVLAGRSDSSGTTALFTRALAAQCTGLSVNTGIGGTAPSTPITNAFANSTTTLPGGVSGVTSGAVFTKGTTPSFTGTEAAGKFTVANGSDGVAQLTAYQVVPVGIGSRTQNGRIGYIGPDYTLPAVLYTGQNDYGLNTASLQVNGVGTSYKGPTAADATAAFTGIQPPQSKGTAGAYCTTTGCVTAGGSAVDSAGVRVLGDRANPLHWVFPANKFLVTDSGSATTTANPLAAPTKGYPVMGTSNILLYTCYDSSAARQAVNGVFATFVGKTTKDSTGATTASNIPPKLLTDPVKGVFARNGLAAMPAAWQTAIAETFFKSSAQVGVVGNTATKLGLRNLWIQDKIPTAATGANATTAANPLCAGLVGA